MEQSKLFFHLKIKIL